MEADDDLRLYSDCWRDILIHVLGCRSVDASAVVSAKISAEQVHRARSGGRDTLLTHETPFWEIVPWAIPDGLFERHHTELARSGITSASDLKREIEQLLRISSGYERHRRQPDWGAARQSLAAFLARYGEKVPEHSASDLRRYADDLRQLYLRSR